MGKAKIKNSILLSLAMLGSIMVTNLAAEEFTIPDFEQNENRSHWVCDYTRGKHDVVLLRCDNMVGLLYDHMLLMDGEQSKTTKYIPIWNRANSDQAAINLVKTVLCDEEFECEVEMGHVWTGRVWTASFR